MTDSRAWPDSMRSSVPRLGGYPRLGQHAHAHHVIPIGVRQQHLGDRPRPAGHDLVDLPQGDAGIDEQSLAVAA